MVRGVNEMPASSTDLESVKSRFDAHTISFSQATNELIGLATSTGTTLAVQVEAGLAIVYCVANNPRTGSGEGTSGGGSFGASQLLPGLLDGAFPNGSAAPVAAYGLLAGILVGNQSVLYSLTEQKIADLVGQDVAIARTAFTVLAEVREGNDGQQNPQHLVETMARLEVGAPLPASDIATLVEGLVGDGSLSGPEAVDLLARVAVQQAAIQGGRSLSAEAVDTAAAIRGLVTSNQVTNAAALDAVTAATDPDSAISLLAAYAGAVPASLGTVAERIAALVDPDASSSSFQPPRSGQTYASSAITDIRWANEAGQLTTLARVQLLSAIGNLSGNANPLHLVGDEIRGLVGNGAISGTDVAAAIASAGLALPTTVTLLVGIGANGAFQLSGISGTYVLNADLEGATAAKLLELVAGANAFTPAQFGAALAAALPADSLPNVLDLVVRAGLSSTSAGVQQEFGAALVAFAHSGAVSLEGGAINLSSALGSINSRLSADSISQQPIRDTQAFQMFLGALGAVSDTGSDVAIGRAMAAMPRGPALSTDDMIASVRAASTPGTSVLVVAGMASHDVATYGAGVFGPALADILATDPQGILAVLDGAIGAAGIAPLLATDGIGVLAAAAAHGSASLGTQIAAEIVSIAERQAAPITADDTVGRLVDAVEKLGYDPVDLDAGRAALAVVTGQVAASLVTRGEISAAQAVSDLLGEVAAGRVDPARAVQVLANFEAAGLDAQAVADGLFSLIDGGRLTATQVIADLNALSGPGTPTALAAAIADEIDEIGSSNLANTAGLGTPEQIRHAATRIAALVGTDPTAADAVLDGLAARIAGGDLTPARAATLLVDVYGAGAGAAALATIADLRTGSVPGTSNLYLPDGTLAIATDNEVAAGRLTATGALALVEDLYAHDAGEARTTLEVLVRTGHVAMSAFDAEVVAGRLPGAEALAALNDILAGSSAVRDAAFAEVSSLVAFDSTLGPAALAIYLTFAGSTLGSDRVTAYAHIGDLATQSGLGVQVFDGLLPLVAATNLFVAADARAELVALLAGGHVTSSQAINDIVAAMAGQSPALTHAAGLQLLAALSTVEASRPDIYNALEVRSTPGLSALFTRADVMVAVADSVAGHLGGSAAAAQLIGELARLDSLSPAQLITTLQGAAGILTSAEIAALVAEIGGFNSNPGATVAYGYALAASQMPLTGLGAVIADDSSHLTPAKAVEILIGVSQVYGRPTTVTLFDGLIQAGSLNATAAAHGVTSAVAAGNATVSEGLGLLAVLAVESAAPGMEAAVALALSDAITGGAVSTTGTVAAADIMSGLEASIGGLNGITAIQLFALVEGMLLARLDEAVTFHLDGAADVAATNALEAAVTAELNRLVDRGYITQAGTLLALAHAAGEASAAQRPGVAQQIVDLGAGLSDSALVAAVAAAGDGAGALSGAQLASVLAAVAVAGGTGLQIEAGREIGALSALGRIDAQALYDSTYGVAANAIGTADQAFALLMGAIGGGAAKAGGYLLHSFDYFFGAANVPGMVADAVSAGTVTAAQAIDAGIGTLLSGAPVSEAVAIVMALESAGQVTQAAAVADIGGSIAASFTIPGSATALFTGASAMNLLTHLAVGEADSALRDLGAAIGGVIAAGQLSAAALSAGIHAAIDGDGTPPYLSLPQAIVLLVGAQSVAGAAPAVGALLSGLVGDTAGVQALIGSVESALAAGTTDGAGAMAALIAGAAGADTNGLVLLAAELGHLRDDGLVGINPANANYVIADAIVGAAEAGRLDGARAVQLLALSNDYSQHDTVVAQDVLHLVHDGKITPTEMGTNLALASAAAPTMLPPAQLLSVLATIEYQVAFSGSDGLILAGAASEMIQLVATGKVTGGAVVAALSQSNAPSTVVATAAATALAAGVGTALKADLLAEVAANAAPAQVVSGIALLGTLGVATSAEQVTLLAQLAGAGPLALREAVANEYSARIAGQTLTMPDLVTTLHAIAPVPSAPNPVGITILARMIDPSAPTENLLAALADIIRPSAYLANHPTETVAAVQAGLPLYYGGPGLSAEQAVIAFTLFSRDASGYIAHGGSAGVADLVSAGRISADGAILVAERVLLNGAASHEFATGAAIVSIGAALGLGTAGLLGAVTAGIGHGMTADEAVTVLTALTGDHDQLARDPFIPTLDDFRIGQALGGLVGHGLTLDAVLADLRAATVFSDDGRMRLLLGIASVNDASAQVAAAHDALRFAATLDAPGLAGYAGFLSADQEAIFLAGLSAAGSVAMQATAGAIAANHLGDISGPVDAAVRTGALSVHDAVVFLANYVAGAAEPGWNVYNVRGVTDRELAALASGPGTPADVVGALADATTGASGGLLIEVGGRIAGLISAGLISATAAVTIIDAAIPDDGRVASLLGAAVSSGSGRGTVAAAAAWIAGELGSGSLSVAAAMSAIESGALSYRGVTQYGLDIAHGDLGGAASLLSVLAATGTAGLPLAAGRAIGDLTAVGGLDAAAAASSIDFAMLQSGLSVGQGETVLFGMAGTGSAGAPLAVARELDLLIGRTADTVQGVVGAVGAAVTAGILDPTLAVRTLSYLAAIDPMTFATATSGIAAGVSSGAIPLSSALAGVLGIADLGGGAQAAGAILARLAASGTLDVGTALSSIQTSVLQHTLAPDTAALMLPALAAVGDAGTVHAVAAEFVALVGAGLAPASASATIANAVGAGTLTADVAIKVLAFAAATPLGSGATLDLALGGSIANLVESGSLTLDQALSDISAAQARGDVGAHAAVGLLAAIATAAPSTHAAIASSLSGLVGTGALSLSGVFPDLEGILASAAHAADSPIGLLLTDLGATAVVATGVAVGHELGALVARGVISAGVLDQSLLAVRAGGADAGQLEMLALAAAGTGGSAAQNVAGAFIGALLNSGAFTSSAAIAGMGAALSSGALSTAQLVPVLSSLAGQFGAGPHATAVGEVTALVTAGQITAAAALPVLVTAAHHTDTDGETEIGHLLAQFGIPTAGAQAFHDGVGSGAVSVGEAITVLFGMATGAGTSGVAFGAARDQFLNLVAEGRISGEQAVADIDISSASLSSAQAESLRLSLAGTGNSGAIAAVATDLAKLETQHGVQTDPFFTDSGMRKQAAIDFLKAKAGTLTLDGAMTDLAAYSASHDVSYYSGLKGLSSLLGRYNIDHAAIETTIASDVATGKFQAELAHRVTEGVFGTYSADLSTYYNNNYYYNVILHPEAIKEPNAFNILKGEVSGGTRGQELLSYDLRVEHDVLNRDDFFIWNFTSNNMRAGNNTDYAYDQSIATLIETSVGSQFANDGYEQGLLQNRSSEINNGRNELATRFYSGLAERDVLQAYLHAELTESQAIDSINRLADALSLGPNGGDRDTLRQIGLAWLDLKTRQVYSDPYGIYKHNNVDPFGNITTVGVAQTMREVLADSLLGGLAGATHSTDVITGYGALLALPASGSNALINGTDRLDAARDVRAYVQTAVFSADSTVETALRDLDSAGGAVYNLLDLGYGKTAGLKNPLGVIHDQIAPDPKSASGYISLGSALLGGAVTGELISSTIGVPALALTALSIGAKVGLYYLATSSMTDRLGGEAGQGQVVGTFKILAATSSLISDTIFNISQAGANYATTVAAAHALQLGDALKHGDAAGIASGIAEIGMDYFVLETGYDPRLIGKVGEDFGIFVFHLFTGDRTALANDVRNLGTHLLDVFAKNIYFGAIADSMVAYVNVINNAFSDIGIAYKILGQDIKTGFLLVGTRLDEAGHAIRDFAVGAGNTIAHGAQDFFTGKLFDGYVAGATVFVDVNFNGIQDSNEPFVQTDSLGGYSLHAALGPLVAVGGTDIATKLPLAGTLTAPVGSTVISPLTTLVQRIASTGDGDPDAAVAQVVAKLALPAGTDLTHLDPIAALQNGMSGAAQIYAATISIANTAALLRAAGATGDPLGAIASAIQQTDTGAALDLKDTATVTALAKALGIGDAAISVVAELITASNTLLAQAASSGVDAASLLTTLTAVAVSAQGGAAQGLVSAGGDADALTKLLAGYTGDGLAKAVDALAKHGLEVDLHKWLFDDIAHNSSSAAGQVYALYDALLGRAPDSAGWAAYTGDLKAGLSLHDLVKDALNSAEFTAKSAGMAPLDDAGFVQSLYRMVQHRDGDAGGLAHYTAALAAGESRAEVTTEFVMSSEHLASIHGTHDIGSPGGQVFSLYDATLGRAPDALGFESLTASLEAGANAHGLAQAFVSSQEYADKFGKLSDRDFVETLYGTALHRASDPGGLGTYTDALAHGASRADVALAFAMSDEHAGLLDGAFKAGLFVPDQASADVARLYYGLDGRAPDASGLAAYGDAIRNGASLGDVATAILASSEYQAKFGRLDDGRFVSALYQGALGRDADPGGMANYTDELAHGVSRAKVAVEIATGAEAQQHLLAVIENGWHLA